MQLPNANYIKEITSYMDLPVAVLLIWSSFDLYVVENNLRHLQYCALKIGHHVSIICFQSSFQLQRIVLGFIQAISEMLNVVMEMLSLFH